MINSKVFWDDFDMYNILCIISSWVFMFKRVELCWYNVCLLGLIWNWYNGFGFLWKGLYNSKKINGFL